MGYALITDLDCRDVNLGQVTIVEDIALEGITLSAEQRVGNTIQIKVAYSPDTTSHRGIRWSLVGDVEGKFSISNSGLLTILEGANNSDIIVKATSTDDVSISATIELKGLTHVVSYIAPFEIALRDKQLVDENVETDYDLLSPDCPQWTLSFAGCVMAVTPNCESTSVKAGTGLLVSATRVASSTEESGYKQAIQVVLANSTYWNTNAEAALKDKVPGIYKPNNSGTLDVVDVAGTMRVVTFRRNNNQFSISFDGGDNWFSFNNTYDFVSNGKNGKLTLLKETKSNYTKKLAFAFDTRADNDADVKAFYNRYINALG